jgi:hypothetical protein
LLIRRVEVAELDVITIPTRGDIPGNPLSQTLPIAPHILFCYCWRCIFTPSRDLAYIELPPPINPICVQLLQQLFRGKYFPVKYASLPYEIAVYRICPAVVAWIMAFKDFESIVVVWKAAG